MASKDVLPATTFADRVDLCLWFAIDAPPATNHRLKEGLLVVMKKILGMLVPLLLFSDVYAERRPDRALNRVIQQFGGSLQFQTSDGDWEVIRNSPEEGFLAAVGSGQGQVLAVLCEPNDFYGAVLYWYEGGDSLGTYYDDGDDQPVTLNWRDPDLTQETQWTHLSYEDQEFDSVILVNEAGGRPVKPQETDRFLDRLTLHGELNTVVKLAPATLVKQATFSLDGAPSTETVKACGQQQTSTDTTLYFPDFVDGGGWSVQLVLSNTSATTGDEAVAVRVYDSDGDAIRRFFDSASSFEIPPLGSRILRSAGSGAIRRGWIEVEADSASVSGLLTYRHAQSGVEVGVKPVELGNQFALFVEESSEIGTGLAIFKPESEPAVELRIRDEEGEDPLDGVFIPHEDFHQRARTMPEWFGVESVDTGFLRDFRGLLFLRSADGSLFAPLGLRFGKQTGSLSAVPVIRGGDVTGGMPPSGTGSPPPMPPASLAPADQDAFDEVFVGKRVLTGVPNYYIDFVSPGRFKETEGSDEYAGNYTYQNTGSNAGTVTLNYDDGDRCTFRLTFTSATSGTATFSCNDGTSGSASWRLVDIPSGDDDEQTSQVCATGSTIQSGSECALQYPQGSPEAGQAFGRFAVGEFFGSEKGCLFIGSGFQSCSPDSVSEMGTITVRDSGNKYDLDFAASKIEDSSSWRISKLSIALQE